MSQELIVYTHAYDIFKSNVDKLIEKYNHQGRRIVMFSTNIIAELTVNKLRGTNLEPEFIVDNAKERQGTIAFGKEVFSPEVLNNNYDDNYLVLIASSFQNEMIKQLEEYGYRLGKHIIKVIDLPELMNDYSHVNREGMKALNSDEVRKVQLGILEKLHEYHQKYGIRYYIHSGTAIGAVRHKGFIPWDDDVDVFVPINDYLKLIELMKQDERYQVISQFNTDYYYGFGMGYLVDNDTICDINKFPIQITTGQGIDLFPLFGMPNDKDDYINTLRVLEHDCLISVDEEQRKRAIERINEFLLQYDYDQCDVVGNILMPFYLKAIFPKDWIGEGTELKFEDLSVVVFSKYDEYLRYTYGDYMKLPPEEKRVGEHYFHTYYRNK